MEYRGHTCFFMHEHLTWLEDVVRTRTGLGLKLLPRDTANINALK